MNNFDKLPQINTNIPRETLAYSADGLILKRPNTDNAERSKVWLKKQYHAQTVINNLLKHKSNSYNIPKMLEIAENEFIVIEERAPGKPLKTQNFEALNKEDQDIIYEAFAVFLNDINQMSPVLNQKHSLDSSNNISWADLVKKLEGSLSSKELNVIRQAKAWFDKVAKYDTSIVMSQGDMNEDNIFYDEATKILSIIDFADAKYVNAHYMFNQDLAKLGWLNIDRVIMEYEKLEKKSPVTIVDIPEISDMRNKLKGFKSAAFEFINSSPKLKPQRAAKLVILKEMVMDISKKYSEVKLKQANDFAITVLNDNGRKGY